MNTVINHSQYAAFDYISEPNEIYDLGDIVINDENEIGVIIQTFSDDTVRTDMFGNASVCEIRPARQYEIGRYRPNLYNEKIVRFN